jgi:hypothetical protein
VVHIIGSNVQARRRGDRAVLGVVRNGRDSAPFIGRTAGEEVLRRRCLWDALNCLVMEGEE